MIIIIVKIADFEKCGVASIPDLGASLFPQNTRIIGQIGVNPFPFIYFTGCPGNI